MSWRSFIGTLLLGALLAALLLWRFDCNDKKVQPPSNVITEDEFQKRESAIKAEYQRERDSFKFIVTTQDSIISDNWTDYDDLATRSRKREAELKGRIATLVEQTGTPPSGNEYEGGEAARIVQQRFDAYVAENKSKDSLAQEMKVACDTARAARDSIIAAEQKRYQRYFELTHTLLDDFTKVKIYSQQLERKNKNIKTVGWLYKGAAVVLGVLLAKELITK